MIRELHERPRVQLREPLPDRGVPVGEDRGGPVPEHQPPFREGADAADLGAPMLRYLSVQHTRHGITYHPVCAF